MIQLRKPSIACTQSIKHIYSSAISCQKHCHRQFSGSAGLFSHYISKDTTTTNGPSKSRGKVSILDIQQLYKTETPISVITAHDYISGMLADKAGVDMVLVGDSLAMVSLGHANTNEIELEDMIYHTRAVSRGVKNAFLVADLPFGSYELSPEHAHQSAIRMVKKGFAEAVKFEGGKEMAATVAKIVSSGIPVLGHIGLTPQRQSSIGGFKVQGKTYESAVSVLEDALALQNAGCFALVLEAVPNKVAELITNELSIPTIGIGAGPGTSGQVLVQLDMLGGFDAFVPKFLKKYADYLGTNVAAIENYCQEVKARQFPAKEHCYPIKSEELQKFKEFLGSEQKNQSK